MSLLIDLPSSLHADPELGLLLSLLSFTTDEWREELGDVDRALIVRQLSAQGQSIGGLLLHIADVEGYWLHEAISGQPRPSAVTSVLLSDETDQYNVSWPTPPDQPLAWYFACLDEVRAQTVAFVQTLLRADQPLVHPTRDSQVYTARWLLGHVATHEAYHGGQAVLLSLMPALSPTLPTA